MIRTTAEQRAAIRQTLADQDWHENEVIWTFLTAIRLDQGDQAETLRGLCGVHPGIDRRQDVWFEAQPLVPRSADEEGNTHLDLAIGDIEPRGNTGNGIQYRSSERPGWVCFVEAKLFSDISYQTAHDPFRNQLARVIENLLCFQNAGQFPAATYFTLLTPRAMKYHPDARLYGYKFRAYEKDPASVVADIARCEAARRGEALTPGYLYPNLEERLDTLRLHWATYEELLCPWLQAPAGFDLVRRPQDLNGVSERILPELDRLDEIAQDNE